MLSRHRGLDATGRAAPRLREDLSAALAAGIAAGLLGERAAVAAVILSRADLIYCSFALLNRTSEMDSPFKRRRSRSSWIWGRREGLGGRLHQTWPSHRHGNARPVDA